MTESARHVEVIYCDDIREELGGKISLMGVYTGDMIVSTIPLTLPKLCIVVTAMTDVSNPFQSLNARVEKGEDGVVLVSTGNIDVPSLQKKASGGEVSNGARFHAVGFHFVLSPFLVEEQTILRVIVETECGPIRGRGIRIQLPSSVERARNILSAETRQTEKMPGPTKSRAKKKAQPIKSPAKLKH